MSKNKLAKFAETAEFENVVQPEAEFGIENFVFKGDWCNQQFSNNNLLVLELGCGRGEYTVALAAQNHHINYIGIDIKGARIWKGAKQALNNNIKNAAFLRTRIDMIDAFFGKNEVDELWITFPDPQPKKQNKRLTSAFFLNKYSQFLKAGGFVNLKTDSQLLYYYTMELLKANNIEPIVSFNDVYSQPEIDKILNVKTYYENLFLNQGKKITYIKFAIPENKQFTEIPKFVFDGN